MVGSPKQQAYFHGANAFFNLADGAMRSGKTHASIYAWAKYIFTGPEGPLLMVGKTLTTIRRNCLESPGMLFDIVGEGNYNFNHSNGDLDIMGKRKISCIGANDIRAEEKIKGATFAGGYIDQCEVIPEGFFDVAVTRMSIEDSQIFATCNPGPPKHWLKEKWIDREDLRKIDPRTKMATIFYLPFVLDDNPVLSDQYKNTIKRALTGVFYKRNILGLWVMAEGVIYDMFDANIHVGEMPSDVSIVEWGVGCDYGTVNPNVYLLGGLGSDGKLYITDEYYYDSVKEGKRKTDREYTDDYFSFLAPYKFGPNDIYADVDPSAASLKAEMRSRDCMVRNARNDIDVGISLLSILFNTERIQISPKCTHLIDELTRYCWDAKMQERGKDYPLQIDDHCCDGLRYLAMRIYPKNIPALPAVEGIQPFKTKTPDTMDGNVIVPNFDDIIGVI